VGILGGPLKFSSLEVHSWHVFKNYDRYTKEDTSVTFIGINHVKLFYYGEITILNNMKIFIL
jgi:hypothetical protein